MFCIDILQKTSFGNVFLSCLWPRTNHMRAVGLLKCLVLMCQQSKASLLRHPSVICSVLCPEPSGSVFKVRRDVWAHRRNCWSSVLLKCIRTVQPACIFMAVRVYSCLHRSSGRRPWEIFNKYSISSHPHTIIHATYNVLVKTPKSFKWNMQLAQTSVVHTSTLPQESINTWTVKNTLCSLGN